MNEEEKVIPVVTGNCTKGKWMFHYWCRSCGERLEKEQPKCYKCGTLIDWDNRNYKE